MSSVPIACNLNAFSPKEREQYQTLRSELVAAIQETRELDSGYALKLLPEAQTIRMAAEFIAFERRCCPFLAFSLVVEGEANAWLYFTGGEGVKAFLQAELGKLAPRAV